MVAPTDTGGWARHLFYETGDGEMIAFWDLHDPRFTAVNPSISEGLGLPIWVNHFAFHANDLEALANAVREAARPVPPREPGPSAPGAPVEIARRRHLRMLRDPGNSRTPDSSEQA